MKWSMHPASNAPEKVAMVFAVAIMAAVTGILIFHQTIMGVLGFAMILGATAEFWLGTKYELNEKEAKSARGPSVSGMEWAMVKRVDVKPGRIHLSPFERPCRMDEFRGIFLTCKEEDQQRILDLIEEFRSANGPVQ